MKTALINAINKLLAQIDEWDQQSDPMLFQLICMCFCQDQDCHRDTLIRVQ